MLEEGELIYDCQGKVLWTVEKVEQRRGGGVHKAHLLRHVAGFATVRATLRAAQLPGGWIKVDPTTLEVEG